MQIPIIKNHSFQNAGLTLVTNAALKDIDMTERRNCEVNKRRKRDTGLMRNTFHRVDGATDILVCLNN